MKKLLGLSCLLAAMLFITSCGSSNTPSGVAKASLQALQKKDYEAFAKLLYFKDVEADKLAEAQKGFASLMQEKLGKEMEKKGGIKSFEIVSEELNEAGDEAVVKAKIEYENGETKDDNEMKLRKDKNGDWKIDLGK